MARPLTFGLDDLVDASLSVVARGGWEALSVRSVAEALGVTPMAIYRVVPDARRLRQTVADAVAREIPAPSLGAGSDLVAALRRWAPGAYRQLCRFPGVAAYVMGEWTELPSWLDIVEAFLTRADREGYAPARAVAVVNAVFAYVLARAQLHDRAATAPRRSLEPLRRSRDRYPLVARSRDEFVVARTDAHFEFGLRALTDGLATARTARRR